MRILGFVPTSLIDWDGKISSVIFIGGCNFVCPFCHNSSIANDDPALPEITWEELKPELERKLGWLDGVVVTGGEPLMHPEIFELCADIKRLGLKVKLDTNGSFPYALKRAMALQLVDFVAMDVKAPFNERYSIACGRDLPNLAPLRRSVKLLLQWDKEAEFRITLVPGLVEKGDMEAIGTILKGAKRVILQQFVPENARLKSYREKVPYSRSDAEEMQKTLSRFVSEVKLRGKFF
ncbi:MAG: anaerobic ribonucleoside-triphosphate reductase activating protein [candidate division WOR-3 bacterium]|jgi:pyruvate formate lyase activating enzyme|nr:anaerobic ribonucleoside-triphosphate reductase activating protein [candidate division WOR-3 bacterium]MDH7519247.1 anaerobic ribonucleoside-triphosphate reductase activating protein [bacterium]